MVRVLDGYVWGKGLSGDVGVRGVIYVRYDNGEVEKWVRFKGRECKI